jgi:tetratricopeptide (TPR) repeat protein
MLVAVKRRFAVLLCCLTWALPLHAAAPSRESRALVAAGQRLAQGKSAHAMADAWEVARLFGAVPPTEILSALQPALQSWLSGKRSTTPTAQFVRHLALYAASAANDEAGLRRWATPGAITEWSWLGPFGDEHGTAFGHETLVERSAGGPVDLSAGVPGRLGVVHWQRLPTELAPVGLRTPLEVLVDRPDDAVLYLHTWLRSDVPSPAVLRFGAEGRLRVWLAGVPVASSEGVPELYGVTPACPPLPEAMEAPVQLTGGWQRLLVKLAPVGAGLPFSASLVDPNGAPLAVTWSAVPPPEQPTAVQVQPPLPRPEPDNVLGLRWPARAKRTGPSPIPALVALAWHGWPMAPGLSEQLLGPLPPDVTPSPQLALGHAMLAGELGDRIDRLRQWAQRMPDSAELLVAQAQALDAMGKTTQAHQLWQAFSERTGKPPEQESVRACLTRVELWQRLQAERVANELLRQCAGLWPDAPELVQAQVRAALAADRLAEVVRLQKHALELEPGRYERHMGWLQAVAEAGDVTEVLAGADRIRQQFPSRSRAWELAAQVLLAEDRIAEAKAALLRVPVYLRRASTLDLLGRVASRLGRAGEAVTHWKTALAQVPARADLRTRLQLLRSQGDFFAEHRRDLVAMAKRDSREQRTVPLEMRLRHTVLQVVGNGQQARYEAEVYYLGPGCDKVQEVTIDYAPSLSRADVLQATVVHADGRVERNASQDVDDLSDDQSGMYVDLERVRLGFRNLAAGDAIVVEYSVRDLAPTPFGLVFGELFTLGEAFPVRETDLVVQLPKGTPLYRELQTANLALKPNWQERTLEVTGADRDDAGVWQEWRLQLAALPAIADEPRMPGDTDVVPYLHLSSFPDWAATARWYAALVAEALPARGSDPVLREAALRLTQGATTPEQKVRALYNFAANQVRYVGLEFGIHSLKPHQAREVLMRQFGDCKDKATLLVALLAEVGIEAQVALVRTQDEGRLHDTVASLGVFNHAIAFVPSLGWWLDATAQRHGPRELPAADAGGTTLRIPLAGAPVGRVQLERLPEDEPAAHARDEALQLTLHPNGSIDLDLQLTLRGLPAAQVRQRLDEAQTRKERIEQDLAARFPGLRVTDVQVEGIAPLADEVRVKVRGKVPQWAQAAAGALTVLPLRAGGSHVQTLAELPKREHDLVLDHPTLETATVRLVPPPGMSVPKLPAALELMGPAGTRFGLSARRDGAVLELNTRLQLSSRRLAARDYPALRTWLAAVDAALRGEVVVATAER